MLEWLSNFIQTALAGTLWPLHEFLNDGGSRYFWLYCLTGIMMAYFVTAQGKRLHNGEKWLFSPDVWWGPSPKADYFVLVFGSVLRLTILSWAFLNWKAIAAAVVSALEWLGVTGTVTGSAAVSLGALMTLTLFLADDFMRWWLHYKMHTIPELWEFHKVHHSAEELNFATAERIHPFEVVLTSLLIGLTFGVVNGLFIGLFGDTLTPITVFGANVFLVVFNIFGGVLRHSPTWISFGPKIERWVISPAMHQIHHSSDPRHYDRNMGGSLSVWDRWFGTIHIPNGREIESFGIGEETQDFRSLGVLYFRPFVKSAELLGARLARFKEQRKSRRPAEA